MLPKAKVRRIQKKTRTDEMKIKKKFLSISLCVVFGVDQQRTRHEFISLLSSQMEIMVRSSQLFNSFALSSHAPFTHPF
jgi:hypothetical protein